MGEVQIFHATLDGARELKATPFHRERDLQRFIEFHLDDLFGIEFLDTEHSTGPHDKQRMDSLGIDTGGRPVVIEYKLRSDKNIINQGLGYLDWLEKHPEAIELLAMKKLGPDKAQRVDLKHPRLLCIAGAFTRNDIVTAENCRASVELVRYCRYGDTSFLLEWVYGGRVAPKAEREEAARKEKQREAGKKAAETRRQNQAARQREQPDFSKFKNWEAVIANELVYGLFNSICDFAYSLGEIVKANPTSGYISFTKGRTFSYVFPQPKSNRLKVFVNADPERASMRNESFRRLPENHAYPPCNAQVYVFQESDLADLKRHLSHSYDEAG